jgi:hypothetical protein
MDAMTDDDHPPLSINELLWVMAWLTDGVLELADGMTGDQLDLRPFGMPMNQTVRLPDGRYVTCVLTLGDEDAFNRTHGLTQRPLPSPARGEGYRSP